MHKEKSQNKIKSRPI